MTPVWEDLVARSRGLAAHLLSPARLATLAAAPDLGALAQGLRESGFDIEEDWQPNGGKALFLIARKPA